MRRAYGFRRPGDAEDRTAVDNPGNCTREDRGRPDLLVTFQPEKFPETVEYLLKQRHDRLDGHIAGCEPCSAGDDYTVCTGNCLADLCADPFLVIRYHGVIGHLYARTGKEIKEAFSTGIGLGFRVEETVITAPITVSDLW